jgi:hypothetical protein
MLLLSQKSMAFAREVHYIMMGKWMGAGLVLVSCDVAEGETIFAFI